MTETGVYPARVENADAASRFVLVCEHASNAFPAPWGDLGVSAEVQRSHVAWDPGALDLARGLAARLGAVLVHAPVSRLIYDLNRPPHSPGAMPEQSEIHPVPGNRGLTADQRAARVAAVYDPFHADLSALLAARLARGLKGGHLPVVVTVHSFTPVYQGQHRKVEFGILHDDGRPEDAAFADALLKEAGAGALAGLQIRLNEPYRASDGVTHLLRRQAVPFGLPHAMLEVSNALIATPQAADAMAERIAPLLAAALRRLENRIGGAG